VSYCDSSEGGVIIPIFETVEPVNEYNTKSVTYGQCDFGPNKYNIRQDKIQTTRLVQGTGESEQSHDCSCPLAPRKSFDILALYKSDYYYYYYKCRNWHHNEAGEKIGPKKS